MKITGPSDSSLISIALKAKIGEEIIKIIRESTISTNLFKNFAVYGFVEDASLFDNVQVSGTALNGDWTYTDKQYWITGAKYSFAAIAPYANGQDGVFSVTKDGENNYNEIL